MIDWLAVCVFVCVCVLRFAGGCKGARAVRANVAMNVLLLFFVYARTHAHTHRHTQLGITLVVNLSALLYRLLHGCSVGISVVGFDVCDDSSSSSSGDVFSRYTRSSSRGRR